MSAAHRAAAHQHPRAHVIQPTRGTYRARTPVGTWLVPAGQALWIPPELFHEVYSTGPIGARMIFVDPAFCDALPLHAGTVEVTPLLGALVERALEHGNDYEEAGPASRLARVLLDELELMRPTPFVLSMGRDPRLVRVMDLLLADPASDARLPDLGRSVGASERTLARLFKAETGMSFGSWRTRLRLIKAIEHLEQGDSVTETALALGYGSTSSFVYAFRKQLGMSPGQWAKRQQG